MYYDLHMDPIVPQDYPPLMNRRNQTDRQTDKKQSVNFSLVSRAL